MLPKVLESQVLLAHAVILATWEVEIRKNTVSGQPGKKSLQDLISMDK
jgi:hypothetical protein